jgi:2-iminobutanoate/2-iminopropanoate deaminase
MSIALIITAEAGAAAPALPDPHYIVLDRSPARDQLPFSDGVVAGNTLYVAGHIGTDPKTGQPPADTELEIRLLMDSIRRTVEGSGFAMDDLVNVQVYCTDLGLYNTFNKIYSSYFHAHYPARALVGVTSLVRGAHFEVTAIAIKGGR